MASKLQGEVGSGSQILPKYVNLQTLLDCRERFIDHARHDVADITGIWRKSRIYQRVDACIAIGRWTVSQGLWHQLLPFGYTWISAVFFCFTKWPCHPSYK